MAKQHHHRHHTHHTNASTAAETIVFDGAGLDRSIQLRAYQLHCEKGGFALDNWLEAELSVKNAN